jgi:hypothetical protein
VFVGMPELLLNHLGRKAIYKTIEIDEDILNRLNLFIPELNTTGSRVFLKYIDSKKENIENYGDYFINNKEKKEKYETIDNMITFSENNTKLKNAYETLKTKAEDKDMNIVFEIVQCKHTPCNKPQKPLKFVEVSGGGRKSRRRHRTKRSVSRRQRKSRKYRR